MARVLKAGGTILLTARGYDHRGVFMVHNEPDYWRFSPGAMKALAVDAELEDIEVCSDPQVPGAFLVARKRRSQT